MRNFKGLQNRLVEILQEKGITNRHVLDAFLKVPRHLFVDEALREDAYRDKALPIGNGQTISQPYIVALMTEILGLSKDIKILEIGTGSGYQGAILSEFSRRVFTVERDPILSKRARTLLRRIGYHNIIFKVGDGSKGWVANAPYDRIIVTAGATKEIPKHLLDQLSDNGRMIIPSGDRRAQQLLVVDKQGNNILTRNICDVVFVPLIGEQGW